MQKRIILDCERMRYPFTGLYFFCKELGKALVRQLPLNNEISFYVPEAELGTLGSNERYIVQKSIHKIFPKSLSGYHLWHCTFQGSNYLPPKHSKLKVVATVHDLNFLHEGKSAQKIKKYIQQTQGILERTDAIVAISNFVKADILNNLNTKGRHIEVIYNGCNQPSATPIARPAAVANRPFFFTIGTINAKKNFHVLPAMLQNNEHELLIAGKNDDPAYKEYIEAKAQELGVHERVRFVGTVSDEEKFWLLQHCSAFCFPSIAEGFGLPVVEAMQFGTPVILSKATSLPEIGGSLAYYFDSFLPESVSNTAQQFLNAPVSDALRQQLKNHAQRFSWDETATRYWALYKSL